MSKTALITGVTGQDGSYLSELLIEKGYTVHGMVRRSSTVNTWRIDRLLEEEYADRFSLHYGDLSDANSLRRLIDLTQPDEIYNLAAQSHVRVSFDQRRHWDRCAAAAGGDPRFHAICATHHPLLSGWIERNVRLGQSTAV